MRLPIVLFLLLPFLSMAQDYSKLSYGLVKLQTEIQPNNAENSPEREIHLLVKGDEEKLAEFVESKSGQVKYRVGGILAVRLPETALPELSELPYLEKAEAYSQPLYFNDVVALSQTSVDTVHAGGGLLQQSYTGKGVIFGMIDSGIDPTHPDFQNDDGSTRILAFWNQNDTLTSLPPYGYGKEYTQQDIDNGLMATYQDTTYGGHGSAVAGVAAGGGRAHPDIKGMAPEADIIAVGINPSVLDYLDRTPSTLNIVDGIDYIFSYADALNKPAVINISLGGMEGSHDGRDLPTQMIDAMLEAKAGRVLVTSAGNSANTRHHIQLTVASDTVFTWFEGMYANTSVCKRDSGAYMSFYGDSADVINLQYKISAEDQSPCCNILDATAFEPFLYPLGQIRKDTLKQGNLVLGYVSTFVEKIENTYAFFMEIESTDLDLLWRYTLTGNGKIDGWAGPITARSCNSTYIEHPATVGNATQIQDYEKYVRPDSDQTIGTAYASSENAITVGAYNVRSSMLDVDSITRNYITAPLRRAQFSSLGPTRDGRIKPEIMGPGARIVTTQASQVLAEYAVSSRSTLYLGGQHSITDGTSFASPAVAGIVALYLEKYPEATFEDVRNAIVSTADTDEFMGPDPLPNNSYGYGRINGYQMLLEPLVGIDENPIALDALIYPNPSRGDFTVQLSRNNASNFYALKVFDLTGRIVLNEQHNTPDFKVVLEQSGLFFIQVTGNDGDVYNGKLVVE